MVQRSYTNLRLERISNHSRIFVSKRNLKAAKQFPVGGNSTCCCPRRRQITSQLVTAQAQGRQGSGSQAALQRQDVILEDIRAQCERAGSLRQREPFSARSPAAQSLLINFVFARPKMILRSTPSVPEQSVMSLSPQPF